MLKALLFCTALIGCTSSSTDANEPSKSDFIFNPHTEELEIGIQTAEECGHIVDNLVCNMALMDSNEEYWELYDLEGNIILLDFSTMWCGPCQNAAATAQEFQDIYEDDQFQYVTILVEDEEGIPVDYEDLRRWVEFYGLISVPTLLGNRDLIDTQDPSQGYPVSSWPTFVFINRDLTVYHGLYGYSEEWLHSLIQEML